MKMFSFRTNFISNEYSVEHLRTNWMLDYTTTLKWAAADTKIISNIIIQTIKLVSINKFVQKCYSKDNWHFSVLCNKYWYKTESYVKIKFILGIFILRLRQEML